VFPALPLSFSRLCPHRHTTRWCRSLSRVAVSCWKCSRLSMMVLVLLGSICSSSDAPARFPSPGAGTVPTKSSPAGRLASVCAPATFQPDDHSSRLGNVGDEALVEGGLLDLPWRMAHVDDQPVDKRRIQMRGFWSTIAGVDQSGSRGYMPNRSRICLDFACMVEELSSKYSQISLAAM
jgi:hypothetical protein